MATAKSSPKKPQGNRVLLFGTADTSKPRVRILLRGLEQAGYDIIPCSINVWGDITDKSQVKSKTKLLWLGLKWFACVCWLTVRYLFSPPHDRVLVCYPGYLDLWFLRLVAWVRRRPIYLDAFLSIYDTVVLDRALTRANSPLGRLCYFLDWAAVRLADRTFLDTRAHARFFEESFGLPEGSVGTIPVGCEPLFWQPRTTEPPQSTFQVLFYGQFIPLHGLPTILEAIRMESRPDINFTLIGRGQMESYVTGFLTDHKLDNLHWEKWVDYEKLPQLIHEHHIGLGVFSAGEKAARVVPNKLYQMLAAGLPVISQLSPATEPIAKLDTHALRLCPADNPQALKTEIEKAYGEWKEGRLARPSSAVRVGYKEVGAALHGFIQSAEPCKIKI